MFKGILNTIRNTINVPMSVVLLYQYKILEYCVYVQVFNKPFRTETVEGIRVNLHKEKDINIFLSET